MIQSHRVQAFRRLSQSYRNAPAELSLPPAASQLADFYDLLADLASGRLLSPAQAKVGSEHLPPNFQKLADWAQDAFSPNNTGEMAQKLKKLREVLGNRVMWPEPEARLLHSLAESWGQLLQSPDTEVRLEISLCPLLVPSAEARPSIAIRNGSSIPVSDIEISSLLIPAVSDGTSSGDGEGASQRGARLHLSSPGVVLPGETVLFSLDVDEGATGRLVFQWQCSALNRSDLREATIELPGPAELEDSAGKGDERLNPYLPDLPMDHEESWSRLARGTHADLVRRILSEPSLRLGKVLSLRGLRRSGKTTILRRLAAELEHDSSLLPVYIDIYSWWLPLKNRGQAIDGTGLLYELADSILRTVWRLQLQAQKSEAFLRPFEDPEQLRLSFGDFERFLQNLAEDLQGRRPFLLLDEFDSWLDEVRFSQDSMALLRQLGDLAESRACSAIVAHTASGARWRERFDRQIPEALFYRVELLKRPDVDELVNLLPTPCTAWARELLWRLTGGWPGLLQLLLYMICQDQDLPPDEEASEARRVDTARIRRILVDFLQSSDWAAHRNHFLRSFETEEKEALRRWIESGALDTTTGAIDHTRRVMEQDRETLLSLREKEAFWPFPIGSECYRLRVGLLGLVPFSADDPCSIETMRT